jgi:hypothetical protein
VALHPHHLTQRHGAAHRFREDVERHRLLEVPEGAMVERPHGALGLGPPGDEHDRDLGVVFVQRFQELEPVHSGHRDVAQDCVEFALAELLDGVGAAGRRSHTVAFGLQKTHIRAEHHGIVVCDENVAGSGVEHRNLRGQFGLRQQVIGQRRGT